MQMGGGGFEHPGQLIAVVDIRGQGGDPVVVTGTAGVGRNGAEHLRPSVRPKGQ